MIAVGVEDIKVSHEKLLQKFRVRRFIKNIKPGTQQISKISSIGFLPKSGP